MFYCVHYIVLVCEQQFSAVDLLQFSNLHHTKKNLLVCEPRNENVSLVSSPNKYDGGFVIDHVSPIGSSNHGN